MNQVVFFLSLLSLDGVIRSPFFLFSIMTCMILLAISCTTDLDAALIL